MRGECGETGRRSRAKLAICGWQRLHAGACLNWITQLWYLGIDNSIRNVGNILLRVGQGDNDNGGTAQR